MMNGPQKVLAGTTLAIDWIVVDQHYLFPGLVAVTMEAGKTFTDLEAEPGYPQPSWVHVYCAWEDSRDRKTVSAELNTGSVYFVCFSSRATRIGAVCPIDVVK